ncbi:hypothetical protein CVT24_005040 [Panaeolus cyanescens]|uniref:Carboxymuconolactone decarboxylase-like domain-containing protein n=1 Tax=Panaeolus cyanescens TaxID=181874 RepID=A0A409VPN3_9AGAR|nr:hypothetical protein CVT24_005040 [Panaeolus cyanescens]
MTTQFAVSFSFLDRLKALFPTRSSSPFTRKSAVLDNPWYIVAAVAYSAGNRPEAVPIVWEYALRDVRSAPVDVNAPSDGNQEELLLARRFREALLKSSLTCGCAKVCTYMVINALEALHAVMPQELQEKSALRDPTETLKQQEDKGEALFRAMYGTTAQPVQSTIDMIYPDMGYFVKTIAYGLIYTDPYLSSSPILQPLESTYAAVASVIAMDTPKQIAWHLDNARRQSLSIDEVRAVRQIAIEAAKHAGVKRLNEVPEV